MIRSLIIAIGGLVLVAIAQESTPDKSKINYIYSNSYFIDEGWLPYLTLANRLIDEDILLNYRVLSKNDLAWLRLSVIKFYLRQDCCDDMSTVLFSEVEYTDSVNIYGIFQISVVSAAVTRALNLDLPIFKPIMLPWDYYLKDYGIYIDYKFSFGRSLKDYLIKKIDIRVFYFFK